MQREQLWLYADRVWERLKKKPIMGLYARGPIPLETVFTNRLLLLLEIATYLTGHPAQHVMTRMVWHRLVQRHLGQKAYNRLRGRGLMPGRNHEPPPVKKREPTWPTRKLRPQR